MQWYTHTVLYNGFNYNSQGLLVNALDTIELYYINVSYMKSYEKYLGCVTLFLKGQVFDKLGIKFIPCG